MVLVVGPLGRRCPTGSTATPLGRRRTAPTSRRSSPGFGVRTEGQVSCSALRRFPATRSRWGLSPAPGARNSSPRTRGGGSTVSGCASGRVRAVLLLRVRAVRFRRGGQVAHRGPGASLLNWTGTAYRADAGSPSRRRVGLPSPSGHEDPGHVRVTGRKKMAEQIVRLAFHGARCPGYRSKSESTTGSRLGN